MLHIQSIWMMLYLRLFCWLVLLANLAKTIWLQVLNIEFKISTQNPQIKTEWKTWWNQIANGKRMEKILIFLCFLCSSFSFWHMISNNSSQLWAKLEVQFVGFLLGHFLTVNLSYIKRVDTILRLEISIVMKASSLVKSEHFANH